ncbi:MAG: hypothetical protein GYA36_22975 [Veillonellaceae bacterium]|nr:hypothetical protein [Veillonellaceae bacterium]
MQLDDVMSLDLWQVRRLSADMEIDAKAAELVASGHPPEAVRDLIRATHEELSNRGRHQ